MEWSSETVCVRILSPAVSNHVKGNDFLRVVSLKVLNVWSAERGPTDEDDTTKNTAGTIFALVAYLYLLTELAITSMKASIDEEDYTGQVTLGNCPINYLIDQCQIHEGMPFSKCVLLFASPSFGVRVPPALEPVV